MRLFGKPKRVGCKACRLGGLFLLAFGRELVHQAAVGKIFLHDFRPCAEFFIRIERFDIRKISFVCGEDFAVARTQIQFGGKLLGGFAPKVGQIFLRRLLRTFFIRHAVHDGNRRFRQNRVARVNNLKLILSQFFADMIRLVFKSNQNIADIALTERRRCRPAAAFKYRRVFQQSSDKFLGFAFISAKRLQTVAVCAQKGVAAVAGGFRVGDDDLHAVFGQIGPVFNLFGIAFAQNGCCMADHQLEEFYDEEYTDSQIEIIFEKAMRGQDLSRGEVRQYKHCFLKRTAEMNQESNWTQQYHYGILLDNNSLLYNALGQGVGADSIGEPYTAHAMSHFLDDLHTRGKLTRTILTCMNPADNDMLCSMTGNFQEAGIPGKLQFGMGWWSNAQPGDISEQINALSRFGLLGRSIGVSTGSRSLLSLVRHEYFRRLLCNLLGNDVAKGLLPADIDSLGALVEDVCYNNAHRFFGF